MSPRYMTSRDLLATGTFMPLAERMRFFWTRTSCRVSYRLAVHGVRVLKPLYSAAHLTPFYLREHSKRILRGALFNDSKFLADINVMDYSLVVGVDSAKNELVVGIVGRSFG